MSSIYEKLRQNRWFLPFFMFVLGGLNAKTFDASIFDSRFVQTASVVFLVVSLSAFLLCLSKLTAKKALFVGWCYGLGVYAWGINWLYISLFKFGGASLFFAILANIFVVLVLSLYWAASAYLVCKLGKTPTQRFLLAAPVIALCEWVRSVFFIGFPWLSIGYSQVDSLFAPYASLGGVWLLSFLVIFALVLLIFIAIGVKTKNNKQIALATMILLLLVGGRFAMPEFTQVVKSAEVMLVQGNIDVTTKFDPLQKEQNIIKYFELTEAGLNDYPASVVVWPETALPFFYFQIEDVVESLRRYQSSRDFTLVTGMPLGDVMNGEYYNGVIALGAEQDSDQYYHKYHLLPFGEYLPMRWLFSFFEEQVEIPFSDFTRGKALQKPFVIDGVAYASSICFESAFGDEIRHSSATANVLLNVSNDGWFDRSKALTQHLQILRLRAIEAQKPIIRATNTGVTAFIDYRGGIMKTTQPFETGVVTGRIEARSGTTPYTRYGDKPWLLFFVVFIILIKFVGNRRVHVRKTI